MNERQARQVLLLRAFEQASASDDPDRRGTWTDADQRWASEEAGRIEGEHATPGMLIARRAEIALGRLAGREAAVGAVLSATDPHPGAGALLIGAAALAGLAGDALASSGRINLLAPPLLGILLWNFAVYVGLLWHALRGPPAPGAEPGPLRTGCMRLVGRLRAATRGVGESAATTRFLTEWTRVGRDLHAQRLAAVLHAAAATFAAATLASLYVRGLAFEYRAGWDSTFLAPAAVAQVLGTVLGPAAWITGTSLPDADQLAALRFSSGPGENAARWIHWVAITLAATVLLPRAALAGWAAARARRLARRIDLRLDADPYFQRLANAHLGRPLTVAVLPYSLNLAPAARTGLSTLLAHGWGGVVQVELRPTVTLGGEDDASACAPPAASDAVVALFALTATPERETHLAFAERVHQQAGSRPFVALIDESAFRQRFTGADGQHRLEQRRDAWRAALARAGLTASFADLSAPNLCQGDLLFGGFRLGTAR